MTDNNEKIQEVCKQFTRQRKMSVTERDTLVIWSSLRASIIQSRQGTARCFLALFLIKVIRTSMN